MELKIPFKLRVKYLNLNEDHFEGKAIFHEKEYKINIHAELGQKKIKVPFPVKSKMDLLFPTSQYPVDDIIPIKALKLVFTSTITVGLR